MYADFTYYQNTYGGSMTESEFNRYITKAGAVLDNICYNRAFAIVDAGTDTATITKIKNSECAIVDIVRTNAMEGGKQVKSESVGAHSVSYADTPDTQRTLIQKCIQEAKLYLTGTNLLYPGFLDNEAAGSLL